MSLIAMILEYLPNITIKAKVDGIQVGIVRD